jgi:hypothetical protein
MTAAQILDVSYGGLKLSFSNPQELPTAFDVRVPAAGVTVTVRPVWTGPLSSDGFGCGAVIAGGAMDGWRTFVDSVA